jgi:hypothetical protein
LEKILQSDNLNKAFKIAEKLLQLNYANRVMYFQYNGTRVPAQFQFSQESIDKKYSFTMVDNNKINLTTQIDVETYLPSFEKTSTRKISNVMERISVSRKLDSGEFAGETWEDQGL